MDITIAQVPLGSGHTLRLALPAHASAPGLGAPVLIYTWKMPNGAPDGFAEREFTSCLLGTGRDAATAITGVAFNEQYTVQGGNLRIGRVVQPNPASGAPFSSSIGVWEADRSALVGHLPGNDSAALITLFDAFDLTELDSGVIDMTPRSVAIEPSRALEVVFDVPRMGVLSVGLRSDAGSQFEWPMPAAPGAVVRGGSLYVDDHRPDLTVFALMDGRRRASLEVNDKSQISRAIELVSALTMRVA